MLELEPPKPTKEFHDAYLEIYGKGKKKTEERKDTVQSMFSLDMPKGEALPNLEMPIAPVLETKPTQKKGLFSGIFSKKKTEEKKEMQELADLDLPPLKISDHKELIEGELVDLSTFGKEEHTAMSELEKLDIPPPKAPEKKEGFFERLSMKSKPAVEIPQELPRFKLDIESPILPSAKIPEKRTKPGTTMKQKPIHDFLAEIKFGAKKKEQKEERLPPMQAPKKEFTIPEPSWAIKPLEIENKEAAFEKERAAVGARDLQAAYEKTHRFETGGFEYMEPIKPLQKNQTNRVLEPVPQMPAKPEFKSPKELKKYMAAIKQYEQQAKKTAAAYKKKQAEMQVWMKKQEAQEKKLNEKMRKMQTMQHELQEKQQDVIQYEPKMQALWKKEDEIVTKEAAIKQKLEETRETEVRIRAEEDAIIGKIKKLEADQNKLEKEEDALTKTVAKLDKDRAIITAKTREFANIVKEIGNAEKELKEKSQMMDDREQRIKRKEKLIETEFSRIEKLKKTAERLKNVEETYTRMKERLRIAYKEYEEKFANQQAYAPQEIRAVPIQPTYQPLKPIPQAKAVDSGDITNLITGTKQLIMDKQYEEANKNINRLMQRYMQIPDNNPRKKEIYYEILGLKNMLKLDLLE